MVDKIRMILVISLLICGTIFQNQHVQSDEDIYFHESLDSDDIDAHSGMLQ